MRISVRRQLRALPWALMVILTASGCGNALTCAIGGDNLKGHVSFGAAYSIDSSTIVVEWSKSSFASTPDGRTTYRNTPGLINIPYSMCIDNDVNIQVRAYQDTSGDSTFTTGESCGRFDLTADGNATYVNVILAGDKTKWNTKTDADITIDSTTP